MSSSSENAVTRRPSSPTDDTVGSGDSGAPRPLMQGLIRGTTVGRFVVLDRLGVGGMGVVYSAYDPELDRKVAVKLVLASPGSANGATRARLLREAQSMAQLSHPNVAAIYDVGTTDDGIYIAMEHIDGFTLTDWLSAEQRPWQEIVRVFVAAGRGIEAAHAAGIVHRDLKPDNLMIGRDGRVRVLDFGLARANSGVRSQSQAGQEIGEDGAIEGTSSASWTPASTLELNLTAPGLVMGTPMYMAPEQHLGHAVDHRSDVYAFCVALWEAVYRQRPFNGRSVAEIATNVIGGRMAEPTGVRIPAWLRATLLHGLARDPDQRFVDMRALLAELGRDRSRRLRFVAGGAGLVGTIAIAIGITRHFTGAGALCEDREAALEGVWDDDRRDAIARAFEAEHKAYTDASWANVEQALDSYATALVAMRRDACEASRVHGTQSDELMGRRMACLERRARRLGALTSTLAQGGPETMQRAVEATDGLPDLQPCADAERLMQGVAPPEDEATRALVDDLRGRIEEIRAFATAGRLEGIDEGTSDLIARARATEYPPLVAETMLLRGNYESNVGRGENAIATLGDALEIAEASGHDPVIAETSIVLVLAEARGRSRFDVADVYARRAAAVLDRMGDDKRLRVLLLSNVGMVANMQGRHTDALAALEQAVAIAREIGRDGAPSMLPILNAISVALLETDRLDEADAAIERALAIIEAQVGLSHPNAGLILAAQARLRHAQDRHAESVELWQRAREVFISSLGPAHSNVGAVSNGEGLALAALGHDAQAVLAFEQATAIIERASGLEHLNVAGGLVNLGAALTRLGRSAEAIPKLKRALAIKTAKLGANHEEIGWVSDLLGDAYFGERDFVHARESYQHALAVFEQDGGPGDRRTAYARTGLGRIARAEGDAAAALAFFERALAIQSPEVGSELRGDVRFELAQVLVASDPKRARAIAEDARSHYRAAGVVRVEQLAELERWLTAHP